MIARMAEFLEQKKAIEDTLEPLENQFQAMFEDGDISSPEALGLCMDVSSQQYKLITLMGDFVVYLTSQIKAK